jgi:hypothetical protein
MKLTQTGQLCTWVGIDGWNNPNDLVQAGTMSEVTVKNGQISQDAYAWYEWIPNGWTTINGWTINPGDTVDFTVCLPNSSVSHASVWPLNVTTGVSPQPIGFGAPSAANDLKGLTVEWVTEDPTQPNKQLYPFPRYGSTFFYDCAASTSTGTGVNLSGVTGSDTLNLTAGTLTESTAQIITPTVLMTYGPSGAVQSITTS